MKKRKAFTLIEAATVLLIISLLMLLILPNLNVQRQNAQKTHNQAMVSTVQTQIDLYANEHPEDLDITFDELQKANYLSDKQVEKANQIGIKIKNNQAGI